MFTAFHFWMFVPQIWVIIAIIAILLELTDGSRIFFLPIGVAALLVAAHLQMTFSNIISASLLPGSREALMILPVSYTHLTLPTILLV